MMPMSRAMAAAVVLIYVMGMYLFRNYGRPWWRSRKIQNEINAMPPLPRIEYGWTRQRDQARMATAARERAHLDLVVRSSSKTIH